MYYIFKFRKYFPITIEFYFSSTLISCKKENVILMQGFLPAKGRKQLKQPMLVISAVRYTKSQLKRYNVPSLQF